MSNVSNQDLTKLDEVVRTDLLTGANLYDTEKDYSKHVVSGTLTGNSFTTDSAPIAGGLVLIPSSGMGGIMIYERGSSSDAWTFVATETVQAQYVLEKPGVMLTGFGSFHIS